MENIDIRESILNNFKGANTEEINESINSALESNDEIILPGLGVFFELLWQNSDDNLKSQIMDSIKKGLPNG